jgi:hypothetical protein
MRAEYDSEADALSIDLIDASSWDDSISIDETYCHLSVAQGVPANIELLSPAKSLSFLGEAARRAGVDPDEVLAAARSALAAPDRIVTLDFSPLAAK